LWAACQEPGEEEQRNAADLAFTEQARDPLTSAAACSGAPGGGSFCGAACPCDDGEGDCDSDSECAPGLRCYRDVGAAFGFGADVDVCMAQCPSAGNGSLDFCSEECPCTSEHGDCDSDAECADGLRCEHDIGAAFGFDGEVDVCVPQCSPFRAGKFDFCSAGCPCAPGQGDCDSDAECADGLRCGKDLGAEYGFDAEVDVCVGAAATTGVRVTVVDTDGLPIPGARATLDGVERTADGGGVLTFESVAPGRAVIEVRAAGHTEAALDVQLVQGEQGERLATLHPLGQPIPFDAGQGAELFHEEVRIEVPAGALVDASGAPVAGEVAVTVVGIAPERAATDVGSRRGLRAGEEVALDQGHVVDIAFWQGDQQLQIRPGATVTVDMLLLDAENPELQPGDTTTIFTYDTAQGAWVEDVVGTVMSTEDGQRFIRTELEHTCWFWIGVVENWYTCYLACNPCNPCGWRLCPSNGCETRNELYTIFHPERPGVLGCFLIGTAPEGAPLPGQPGGDCHTLRCRNEYRQIWWWLRLEGSRPVNEVDVGDRPNDGNACTSDTCKPDGRFDFSPLPSGSTPAGLPQTPNDCRRMACNGIGGQTQLPDDADAPVNDGNPCTTEQCSNGSRLMVPAGTMAAGLPQTPGDCTGTACNGSGGQMQIADDADVPADDGNPCTNQSCVAGAPVFSPLPAGTVAAGLPQTPSDCLDTACDGSGGQTAIANDADVPVDDGNPCSTEQCAGGARRMVPAGTVVAGLPQTPRDCRATACDGAGGTIGIADDGDTPSDDGNLCTDQSCSAGVPVFPPLPAGTPVAGLPQTPNDCRTSVCDGGGGQTTVPDDGDTPAGGENPCMVGSCSAGAVVFTPVPAGTIVAGLPQTDQDCRVNVCDGSGGQVQIADTDDTPAGDGNECTDDVCDGTFPSYPATLAGTSCDQDGLYCNGNRDCVECLSDSQCASLVCSALGRCLPPTCEDGVKNGTETAMDCGGLECDPCGAGAVCREFGDCQSQVCAAGRCAPARCIDLVHNGQETDVDCGGPICGDCEEGLRCFSAADCVVGLFCSAGVCTAP
jgi:hypothetical protein